MTSQGNLGELPSREWRRLQEITDRLEQAWQQTADPRANVDLARFLPPPGDSLRPVALAELIASDLEARWRRGAGMSLERYLAKFPELGPPDRLPAKLIYEEYRVRHRHGDRPPLESYRGRFPDQYAAVEDLVCAAPAETLPHPGNQKAPELEPTTLPSGIRKPVLPIGEYQMIERIGSGSYGEVWKAEAPGGVPCAVKIIYRPIDQQEAKQELHALELIRQHRHPYLVQTQLFRPMEGRLYIVMELADGTLRGRLKECRKNEPPGLPVPELLRHMHEAAEALDYLHEENVHHRDVKPENLLLLKGHVKVADFGLARLLQDPQSLMTATSGGTPAYMAPEVWNGKFSIHSDQYSLAVTYYELRLGRRLYQSQGLIDLMRCHTDQEPNLAELPEAERQVLRRALAKNPNQRYPTCLAFAEALQEALAPAPKPPEPAPPPPRRWRLLAASVAAAACIPLAFLYYFPPSHGQGLVAPGRFTLDVPAELTVAQGSQATFAVHVRRDKYADAIPLTLEGLPAAATFKVVGDGDERQIEVTADPATPTGTHKVTVAAAGTDPPVTAPLDLTVLFLPPRFVPEGDEVAGPDYNGKKYYRRIARVVDGAPAVVFVLVPRKAQYLRGGKTDLDSYYIMENKVPEGLFRLFARKDPDLVAEKRWQEDKPDRDRYPALGVTAVEARRFAKWLGGRLPATDQWDKAAGYYEEQRGEGPYRGRWDLKKKPDIAVGLTAPRKVGTAEDDVSCYGCRDMAGNGKEWTGTLEDGGVLSDAPPSALHFVLLRGQHVGAAEPFQYSYLDDPSQRKFGALSPSKTEPPVGFRVVIEP